ncbi:hypothetical protein WJX75_002508 [Coccomyxa subellipsoidea]|uniref:Glycoside hydrolase n=1 Tax=Coccomyxa subellipsoidea TaxID=248742 RepID=A0ABR2YJE3_9CHLO
MIHNNDTGNVAVDFYHRYPEDFRTAIELSAKIVRISISWARIYPNGDGAINQAGLDHYLNMVDEALAIGLQPVVTCYHWDLPQALQDRFGGWNSEEIVPIFANYTATVYEALGDKVMEQAANCTLNVLKSHAASVKEFRKLVPGGMISMNLNAEWALPKDPNSEADKAAVIRKMELPYLPEISPELAKDLAGSMDYLALNHYTSTVVNFKAGDWLYSVPWGFRALLNYLNVRYKPDEISITENGYTVKGEDNMSIDEALNDTARIKYLKGYLDAATEAFYYDKVPIKNYCAWALMDNFEWQDGYSKHFGVMRVNRTTQLRTKKASARYLADRFSMNAQ